MTDFVQKLYQFWSSFGIPAYAENSVPTDAVMPYITYRLCEPNWKGQMSYYARVWYESTSYVSIINALKNISFKIDDGFSQKLDGGFWALYPDQNFIQFVADENPKVKCAYLSMILEVNTK